MSIVVIGASHVSAPLSLLERLSVPSSELDALLARLKDVLPEVFVLSTCNRTEIYAAGADIHETDHPLIAWFGDRTGTSTSLLTTYAYMLRGEAAVAHAMRVASGLDSMVLGEDQIQAQMKRALAAARAAETLGATMERLGAAALGCGKRVRAFTGVGQHSVSLESIAVDAATTRVGSLGEQRVVVLGSGSSAGVVTRRLKTHGANVTIVGRSHGSAAALAADTGATFEPWELVLDALVNARVVFCCTSAPHPVLTRDALARRIAVRAQTPLLCVDLGMPHDVDPDVATIPNVSTVSLEELGRIAATHRAARAQHVPHAEALVERETGRFMDWLRARSAAPAIASSRALGEALVDAELKRALARLQTANAHDRVVIAELARRLARKLMHRTTEELKLASPGSDLTLSITEREEAVS